MFDRCVEYLQRAELGDYVSFENRSVEVTNMCGGRYLCYEDGEVSGQVSSAELAAEFLMN